MSEAFTSFLGKIRAMPDPSRRAFLNTLASGVIGPLVVGRRALAQNSLVRIDAASLRQRIEALSVFGRPSGGTFADGVSRVAYSDADIAGRRYMIDLMQGAGLGPRVDAAGNIFGRRAGTDASLPPILFGSHIDSVPSGGNFDGDLGSLAALGALEALAAANVRTRHPLEMVVWSAEEGVAFGRGLNGSRIVAGDVKPADMELVWSGMTLADAIRRIGGEPDRIMEAVRPPGAHHCYLELHIEQGGTLERQSIPVGVVEGIVSIDRHEVTVTGVANHAGTTVMADRQDALLAASHLTIAVRQIVGSEPGRQVGTVGRLDVTPNAPNVIPGVVRLTVELRDLSPQKLTRLVQRIRLRATEIAKDTKTSIEFTASTHNPPADAAVEVQQAIERSAGRIGLATQRMPSGAGHDAQMMARLSPMGMIFVPSVRGVSHSPLELTHWSDCAQGGDVLLGAVLELDRV
jgi:beta-ureidopropionase / N-carbamoyl-L-amino-acid hydrolase